MWERGRRCLRPASRQVYPMRATLLHREVARLRRLAVLIGFPTSGEWAGWRRFLIEGLCAPRGQSRRHYRGIPVFSSLHAYFDGTALALDSRPIGRWCPKKRNPGLPRSRAPGPFSVFNPDLGTSGPDSSRRSRHRSSADRLAYRPPWLLHLNSRPRSPRRLP
jgi:hypothetical protein